MASKEDSDDRSIALLQVVVPYLKNIKFLSPQRPSPEEDWNSTYQLALEIAQGSEGIDPLPESIEEVQEDYLRRRFPFKQYTGLGNQPIDPSADVETKSETKEATPELVELERFWKPIPINHPYAPNQYKFIEESLSFQSLVASFYQSAIDGNHPHLSLAFA